MLQVISKLSNFNNYKSEEFFLLGKQVRKSLHLFTVSSMKNKNLLKIIKGMVIEINSSKFVFVDTRNSTGVNIAEKRILSQSKKTMLTKTRN